MVASEATGLRKGLAILLAFDGEGDGASGGRELGVTQISELVGREKSQVSRTLKVLAEYGLVDRDPDTLAYRLGWRVFALAGRAGEPHLLTAAGRVLRRLVDELGETAHLSLLRGAEVVTLLSESPNKAVQAAGGVGRTVPAHCTSSGRALLFDHEPAELAELLEGVALTGGPNAPGSVDELYARIEAARARGVAVVDEEFEAGLVAAGAPVRDFRGRIVAAVNVSAPKFRFAGRLAAAAEAVKSAADELSRQLGSPRDGASG